MSHRRQRRGNRAQRMFHPNEIRSTQDTPGTFSRRMELVVQRLSRTHRRASNVISAKLSQSADALSSAQEAFRQGEYGAKILQAKLIRPPQRSIDNITNISIHLRVSLEQALSLGMYTETRGEYGFVDDVDTTYPIVWEVFELLDAVNDTLDLVISMKRNISKTKSTVEAAAKAQKSTESGQIVDNSLSNRFEAIAILEA